MPTEPDKNLKPILDQIILHGVDNLSVVHRCRLIQKICDDVHVRRWQNVLKGCSPRDMNIDMEDDALAILVSSLPYSPTYKDFFHRNAEKLGRDLAITHPYNSLKRQFNNWSGADRLGFLRQIGEKQVALFNHDMLAFAQVTLTAAPLPDRITGEFSPVTKFPLINKGRDGQIKISENHLNTNSLAKICSTLWHENVHALSMQFAAAVHDGRMSENNPFYADASQMHERFEYYALIDGIFRTAYESDPEENLAFATSDTFINSWKHHSSWHMRTARALGLAA